MAINLFSERTTRIQVLICIIRLFWHHHGTLTKHLKQTVGRRRTHNIHSISMAHFHSPL